MPQLQINCFGTFQVLLDGKRVTAFPTDKARALLVYLAVEGQAHARTALAQLLWPGYGEESANNSLRQSLHRLRQLLPDTKEDRSWLLITRHTVQINPDVVVDLDVLRFTKLIEACYTHPHTQLVRCQPCLERLRQAVDLYVGDFLAGLTIADSDPFEEWRRVIQEQCHVAALEALERLTDAGEATGNYEEAQHFAERQIALEPWREQAHRQLMRVLAHSGRRSAALTQYHTCRQLLLEELGSEPEALTTSLYEQIRSGELEERKPARKPIPSGAPQGEGPLSPLPEAKSEETVSLARSLVSDVALPETDDRHEADRSSASSSPLPPPPDLELAVAPVSSTRRHNLPPLLTLPLGRQAMIERTRAALAVAPLVTLTGVGGVGKTTLALQVASTLVDEYADGVWLVELARLADAQLLPASLANALGLCEAAETELLDTLISYLQSKELLLLLDNCEHLLSATHQLCSQLLTSCPHVRILATSRAPLRLSDEQVLAVVPLSTPTTLPPIAELSNYPAVQLFVARVQAINPRFTLTEEDAATVLEICQRLDGLPLALELAAARVRLLSLKEIAERLDRRFSLLRATPNEPFANGALRHQTLRATIDWGYELLSEAEQRLFRHLAIFAGGFTLAAVEAMSGEDALDLLAALVDKSFVVQERNAQSTRFYLLDTLRDYALEKLIATDEEAVARQHHLSFFLQLAERAETHYNSPSQFEWFNRIAGEHDNLRAALTWALLPAAESAILALRLVGALGCFWEVRGHLSEAKEALLRALAIVQADSAVNQWRAKALYWAGGVLRLLGDYAQAKALLQESLALHQDLHNQAGMAQVLIRLGLIWDDEGKYDKALHYYEESHRIYQQLRDNWGISVALNNRSSVAYYRGDYVTARRLAEESVARIRTTGDQRHLANFLTTLAEAAQLLQDFVTTRQALAEAFAIHSANGDKMRSTVVLCGWAEVDRMQGDTVQARQRYLQSLSLAFVVWERRRIAISLEGVARCTAALGAPQLAVELWSVAASLRSTIGAPLPPAQIPKYESDLAAAKQSLGEDRFANAWDTGRWLSLDQALRKAEAWEGGQEDKENELPSHPVLLSPPHNLPADITPFIGRTHSTTEILSRLQQGVRLLTLIGPGGMGKTRLALAVGQHRLAEYPDGVWFVTLAALTNPAAIVTAIASALNLTITGEDPRTALVQLVQPKRLLLILDNFEHLLAGSSEGVELIATLLQAAPGVQMLVTSRERLQLRGEQLYQVPPLTVHLNATMAEATMASAVRLFVQSAQFVQADFQLTLANLETVLRICHLVQGVPLGLELAAAHVGTLPLNVIANEIATSAKFLQVDWHDLPERQRSMRAVFDWSWRLLAPKEQRVLRQISIFQGGFDQAAAQTVADAPQPILNRLLHKSLLQWQEITPGKVRYVMHELLRQFAAEELDASGERAAVEERHGRYYLAYLAARGFRLGRSEPKEASAEIQAELDNVRLAWHWAATQGGLAELDQAVYAWWQFCLLQGLGGEARQSLVAALTGVRTLLAQRADDVELRLVGTRLLSKLLALHANYLFAQGHDETMAAQAREAMQLGAASGGFEGEILGTYVLGRVLQDADDQKREAQALWKQTLQLIHHYQTQQPANELLHEVHWMTHEMLRGSALHFGDYAGCRAHIVEALRICQRLGKQRGELSSLSCLAEINFFLYDFAAAETDYRAELALGRSLGYRQSEMSAKEGLARCARLRGDYATARTLLEESLSTATELALHYDEALFLAALIRLHCQLGDQTAAATGQARLTQLLAQVKLGKECQLYGCLAAAIKAQAAGDKAEALAMAEHADRINQQGGDILFRLIDTALILGHTRAAVGQWEAATAAFQEALAAFQQFGNHAVAAEAQAGLAQIALAQGDCAGALVQIEALLPVLAEEPHAGYNDPFFIYLIGYRVLVANGDPRAIPLLQQGYYLLQQDAARLDEESHQRFLTGVPLHAGLVAAYTEMQAQQDKKTGRQEDKKIEDRIEERPTTGLLVSPSPSALYDWAEMPAVDWFVERRGEVAQLTAWLTPTTPGAVPARLVSILGMGGMGKTTLAAVVTKAVSPHFAVVIWRSLLNAPPLSELLHSWLQTFSRQTLTTLPESLDGQLRLLLTYLQQERCLLVLDNVESIFAAEPLDEAPGSRAGMVRAGYEGYDQLFQRLANSDHQSCLLLTSREQPYALLRSGRQAQVVGRVQMLPLTGLEQQAGYELLQSNGLYTSAAEAAQLVKNYSGNPLALQIVASTIADFFGGDVAAFHQEEGQIFDGMRLVLDQQFARLSPLEREILIWLAIEREPVTVSMLRANLVQPVATGNLLEALQALQNRSLLEKREAGLTLQNVIIEYTTEYLVKEVCRELINDKATLVGSVAQSFLNRFALLKAQSKEYTRQSQERLLLQPVAAHWQKSWGQKQENMPGQQLLDTLRQNGVQRGYAAGNLLNILIHLGIDLNGYDFSQLCIWQADLRRSVVRNVNLAQTDLSNSSFIQTFSRIEKVAISPDGQLLAAAGDGGAIRLFRLPNGEPHQMLIGHTNTIISVDFSPDGAYLASTGDDGLVLLWAIDDGQLYRQLGAYPAMRVVAFSPDGRLLAGASRSGTVLLWQVESGHLLRTLPLHAQRVNAVAFHPDGNLLASASSDGTIYLLDVSGFLHDEDAQSGELVVGSDPQQVSRHVRALIADPKARFFTVAFSLDGQRLVAGSEDGKLIVWNTGFDAVTHQALGHRGQIRTVVFCADSRFFFSGGYDGAIRLWDSQDMRCCQTLSGHKETVYSLALGRQDQLMASGSEDATICLWEINTQTQCILRQRLHGYPQALECVAWSGCGRWLATGDIHGSVRLWDLQHATPRCTQEITGESTVISLHFTRDGQRLVIGRYADPKGIQIWEVRADGQWYLCSGQKLPLSGVACFSPDASLLATCANDGTLRLWNTQPLAERAGPHLFIGNGTYVNRMTFTAKGQTIATCSNDLSVRLWQIDTGEESHRLPGFGNNTCLAVNPQGTLLACSAPDFAIALWDLADSAPKQPRCHLIGHTNEAFACAFSPDGQLLVSAGLDRSVRLWDVKSGTQRALLGYHEQYALDVAFSPNGQQVASIGKEGALYIWQINPYKRLHQLHAPGPYAGMNITGVTGISDAQKAALKALGAVDALQVDTGGSDKETGSEGDKEKSGSAKSISSSPSLPVSPSSLLDWAEMPTVDLFIERSAEVAQLTAWLTTTEGRIAPTRLISILGMGGMGKTTLAAMVTKAVAPSFNVVIWRSLLNAPPLSELLRNWLQTLSRQTLTIPPDSLDEQLRLLLTYLQQERCLLVLDNVESIFVANPLGESTQSRAGVVRPGYEGYDQLFQRLASSEHQSCLLLTSREQPYALLRSGRQAQMSGRIQLLPLTGLDQQAAYTLLQSNGLHTSAAEAAQLVKNYSGNPLALQIVAATIADFFGGDVAAFQQEDGQFFDGLRLILDQQFARLSPLEREILIWLAIEREPVTVPTLRNNFVQPVTTPSLLEALQALQNRSLLEKNGDGFTLQNVIIEYTTEYLIEQVCQEITELRITSYELRKALPYEERATRNAQRAISFLNRFALLKAQAKKFVRQSQARLILQPVADRLVTALGRAPLVARIRQLLDSLRAVGVQKGYAGGNLLNLLVQLGEELIDYNFSHVPVWQADLSGLTFVSANFTGADLSCSTFTAGILVDSVAFQPNGELWVAGIQNGALGLWRTVEGQLTDAFQRTDNLRAPLVFSPDGRLLATDSEDYRIRIWSTTTGECLQALDAHQSTLYTLAFSDDGSRLASCGSGRIVRLWDLHTGHCYQRLQGYEQGADALTFSPDGQVLATGGGDGLIQLWDARSTAEAGRRIAAWQAHRQSLGALAFSPDGRWLASGSHAGEIQLWEITPSAAEQSQESAGNEGVARPYHAGPSCQGHTSIIRALCFVPTTDPATYLLASASADRTVRIWSLAGQLRNTLLGHTNALHSLSISPDGQQLASAGNDKQIILWDVATGQALHAQQAYRSALQCLAYSPDGKMLACGGADPIVRLWSMAEEPPPLAAVQTTEPPVVQAPVEIGQVRHFLRGHSHFLCSVAFSPDGQTVASGDADRTIRLWDCATGQALQTVREHQWSVRALAFAPTQSLLSKGESLLASAGADRIIRLWSVTTQRSRQMRSWHQLVGHEDEILALAFDPRGRHLVSGCADGSIRIWDVQSGMTLHQLTGHTAPVTTVAIHPTDNIIASSCFDQTIRLWDLTTGACLQVDRGGHVGTDAVAFSPDGQYLAYTSNDFAIYLWPWRTATLSPILPTTPLRGHRSNVNALSFSPTAASLASCSDDGTIRLWDVESKSCCQILRPPGPYAGMKITDVTGISEAQKASLRALGAIEE